MKRTGRDGKTAVCVGTITDDLRLFEVPKIKVRSTDMLFLYKAHDENLCQDNKMVANNDRNDAQPLTLLSFGCVI